MSRTFLNSLEQSHLWPITLGPVQRNRPVVVMAFGKWLQGLRGKLSRQQVVNRLDTHGVKLDPSTLHQYEHGTVAAPDPVVLLELSELYQTDLRQVVSVLRSNRANPKLKDEEVEQVLREVAQLRDDDAAAAARLAELKEGIRFISAELFELIERATPPSGGKTTSDRANPARPAKGARGDRRLPAAQVRQKLTG